MTNPEAVSQSSGTEEDIWKFLLQQISDAPKRYHEALANQPFAANLNSLPLDFNRETVRLLSAGSILERDIESINLCLEALRGKVTFKIPRNPEQVAVLPAEDAIANFDRYNPNAGSWRIGLASGNIANFMADDAPQMIDFRP